MAEREKEQQDAESRAFLDLAGSVSVPAGKANAGWKEIRRHTRLSRSASDIHHAIAGSKSDASRSRWL
jgi:hypothetical protein